MRDEKGEKAILRSSWDKAQEEYNKVEQLADNKTIFYNLPMEGMCEMCGITFEEPELIVTNLHNYVEIHKDSTRERITSKRSSLSSKEETANTSQQKRWRR